MVKTSSSPWSTSHTDIRDEGVMLLKGVIWSTPYRLKGLPQVMLLKGESGAGVMSADVIAFWFYHSLINLQIGL